jgi:hypothetical protein
MQRMAQLGRDIGGAIFVFSNLSAHVWRERYGKGRKPSMTQLLHLTSNPAPAQPRGFAWAACAHRAGGEVHPYAIRGGSRGLKMTKAEGSDRFGREHCSAGGPGGGARGA